MGKQGLLIFVFAIMFLSLACALTFSDTSQSNFDLGSYVNTTYNGSAVMLVGNNLSGMYTSRIFDAGNLARWDNLTSNEGVPELDYMYVVDGGGDVYKTLDALIWNQTVNNYGRTSATMDLFSDGIYLYILSSNGNEVWRSSDEGVSFTMIYSGFDSKSPYFGKSFNGSLYIVTAPGEFWKSTNFGVNWAYLSDVNPGTQNPKGFAINSSGGMFVVDGTGDVYSSIDFGVNWVKVNDGYGGSTGTDDLEADSQNNLYILLNKELFKSTDSGVTWTVINDSVSPHANVLSEMMIDPNDKFYAADGIGRVFGSDDHGVTWQEKSDMNGGASNTPKGLTDYFRKSNLTFQVKNCSLSDCSDGSWQTLNLNKINLTGRYFQYKTYFTSQEAGLTPLLYNVSVGYTLLNMPPVVKIVLPVNGTIFARAILLPLNFSVSDAEDNLDRCWYNLDNGVNTSLPSCANITFSASEGSHVLNVFANDSYGLEGKNSSWFRVDTTPPSVIVESPLNASYKINNILINLSLSDVSGIGVCWYNLDYSSINWSLPGCLPTSIILDDGSHFLRVYVSDSVGNVNTSLVSFYVDATPPRWSVMQQAVVTPYSSSASYFNITWIDSGTIQSVLFESNFSGIARNYSMYFLGGNVYGFNVSLPAGGFYWRSHANDSLGNMNSSAIQTFSVAKAGNPVYLYLNGTRGANLTVNYGVQSNATGTVTFGVAVLRRDGAIVSNPEIAVLAAKPTGYLYNVSVQENQNYSGNSTAYYLIVEKLEGNVSLFLNGVESNLSIGYGTQTNASAWNSGMAPALYRN
ncbi:MAG: hypothetical protein KKE05_02570, partial [Nanoarchaeota archaeon]|nr:hypothetical protein [Nanoarchaeota archaeon]